MKGKCRWGLGRQLERTNVAVRLGYQENTLCSVYGSVMMAYKCKYREA